MTAQLDWKAPAEYIADGAGTGAFIDKIEAGEARLIAATEADIAAAARLNDMKFLDTSHRMNVRGDVQEIFAAVNDDGSEAIDEIGRASCRERVGQHVLISGVAGPVKKKEIRDKKH